METLVAPLPHMLQSFRQVVLASSAQSEATASSSPKPPIHVDPSGNLVPGAAPSQEVKPPGSGTASTMPGVTYSPYNSDGTCKTAGRVLSDFQQLSGKYSLVRIYGVDCDQVNSIMPAASSISIKVMLGIFNLNDLESEISQLIQASTTPRWLGPVAAISVGNELVNNGRATPDQVNGAVSAARRLFVPRATKAPS